MARPNEKTFTCRFTIFRRRITPKPACWWWTKSARHERVTRSKMFVAGGVPRCSISFDRKASVWWCNGKKQLTRGGPGMADALKKQLERWVSAGLVDAGTAARIRTFEESQGSSERLRWPVLLAVALGGVLLCAGILLFVAAHWGELSPAWRFTLVLFL